MKKVEVPLVGVGDMGLSHARARPRHDATHRVEAVINSLHIVLIADAGVRAHEVSVL
jgi:hypothetical protein